MWPARKLAHVCFSPDHHEKSRNHYADHNREVENNHYDDHNNHRNHEDNHNHRNHEDNHNNPDVTEQDIREECHPVVDILHSLIRTHKEDASPLPVRKIYNTLHFIIISM